LGHDLDYLNVVRKRKARGTVLVNLRKGGGPADIACATGCAWGGSGPEKKKKKKRPKGEHARNTKEEKHT